MLRKKSSDLTESISSRGRKEWERRRTSVGSEQECFLEAEKKTMRSTQFREAS
jgi:hypothetical protein